jgi:dienelactone hydrolase
MARRLGTVGYYVLLPNLYYRAGRDTIYGPDVQEEGSAEHKRMRAVRTKMTIPPAMDLGAMLAFVAQQHEVKRGAVGCHGYCMSGPYALAAAARYPEQIAAAASFYGTWLVSEAEESRHLSVFFRSGVRRNCFSILPHDRCGRFEANANDVALNGELPTASQFSEAPARPSVNALGSTRTAARMAGQ